MPDKRNDRGERYQLRKAAGLYWLLDMRQTKECYRRPLPMNEIGALIWERTREGNSPERIADCLSSQYGISFETALEDVNIFIGQLRDNGIIVGDIGEI